MKFPKFYNPFRRIRDLEATIAANDVTLNGMFAGKRKLRETIRNLRADLADARLAANENAREAIRIGNNWHVQFCEVVEELGDHEQAVEAFMVEREELKANIALRDTVGVELVGALMEAEGIIQSLKEAVADAQASDTAQTQETVEIVEIVEYVKACEAALSAVGITIEDGEEGPQVRLDQEVFLSAVRLGILPSPKAAAEAA